MASTLTIRPATLADLPAMAKIYTISFGSFPTQATLGITDTPSGRENCALRHQEAWKIHLADTDISPAIVCVSTNPTTGEEIIVAFAEWYSYPTPASFEKNGARAPAYLFYGSWLPDSTVREELVRAHASVIAARKRWAKGRGIGILMFMCTAPDFRRNGAASLCVRWGLDRCAELGIPALLEASDMGMPVYTALEFEVVERVRLDFGGKEADFPPMLWWPPGTRSKEKRRLGG